MSTAQGLDPAAVAGPPPGRAFRWFLTARAVSILGSAMSPVALAFGVLAQTGSARDLSYVLTASTIPTVALIILGGGVADRFRRDALLRVTHLVSGLIQAGVASCVLTRQPVVLLVVLAFLGGTVQAFSRPALGGITPELVGRDRVQRANSLLAGTRNAASIVGPTAAGILVATVGGGWALALDSFSFFAAAACMMFVRLPGRPRKAGGGLLKDLRYGWTSFRSTSWIWAGTLAFAAVNAIQMGVWQVLGPVLARQTIGAAQWGAALSARAVGLLAMSTLMILRTVRRPLVTGMLWLAVSAVPLVLLGLRANVVILAAGALVAGLGASCSGIVWDTARHRNIPADALSRVTSYDDFGSFAGIPVGQLAVIPLAAAIGATRVALYGGLLYAVVALLPLGLPSVRRLGAGRTAETSHPSRPDTTGPDVSTSSASERGSPSPATQPPATT
jgi:MFS family permease